MVLALLISIPPDDTFEYRAANTTIQMELVAERLSKERMTEDIRLRERRGSLIPTGEIGWRELWINTFGLPLPGQLIDERGYANEGTFLFQNDAKLAEWDVERNHIKVIGPWRLTHFTRQWAEESNYTEPLESAKAYWQAFSRRLFADERTIVTSGSSLRAETRTWIITGHYVKDGEIVRYADGKAVGFRAEINGIETLLEQAKFGPLDL